MRLILRPSRRAFAALCLLHGAAIVAPWLAAIAWSWQAGFSVLALLGFGRVIGEHRRESQGILLACHAGRWTLQRHGHTEPVELLPNTVVAEYCVWLRLRRAGRVHAQLVLGDSCTADEMRRLRAALRLSAVAQV